MVEKALKVMNKGGVDDDSLDSDSDMLLDDDSAESEELEVSNIYTSIWSLT